jgi:hypothetical protein
MRVEIYKTLELKIIEIIKYKLRDEEGLLSLLSSTN